MINDYQIFDHSFASLKEATDNLKRNAGRFGELFPRHPNARSSFLVGAVKKRKRGKK